MINSRIKIVLGSSSPRRQQLLKLIVKDFSIRVSNNNEKSTSNNPQEMVKEISLNKSHDIPLFHEELLITADTIVALGNTIFGKPKDYDEAFKILKTLSGCTHQVYTGVTLRTKEKATSFSEVSHVTFYELEDKLIDYYITNYSPYDKAGAYAIQDFAAVFVKKIEGDYYNIMGLPVAKLFREINKFISTVQ
ncbi:MAG: Maf family protein [Defluviitoga tunisiensis]|uniref:dTTP/UTP pyrophosphatase n=1 Tax=Defluviitoga tunisiensis TaxID=1006576 RepID=A0A0C7NM62_DEFTU|nr:Maf family protein [Defluviitoga tunisiensis]MDD3600869.1 Maf family protein [Defluviitoga tunisiensis]CEP78986.1 nucleotide binding protein [Defluviitoga tunisiensis]HHV01072.1 septum formation protein Maf [Defluviitoga tunisiensis]HOB55521.1 Maf family protein [Defluviitoga tunisiensis]HOK16712.1 Maf family protein [Defluviitoga tunisiensis]